MDTIKIEDASMENLLEQSIENREHKYPEASRANTMKSRTRPCKGKEQDEVNSCPPIPRHIGAPNRLLNFASGRRLICIFQV